jgi:Uma2 family endonuclease
MATTVRHLTEDNLETIPEDHEGDRHELIDGVLFVTPVPMMDHQDISSNIVFALEQHVRQENLGKVRAAPTGVRFAPDTLVVPDACFVSRDRLEIIGEKPIDGPPDLVVEILSPGTRRRDLTSKRDLYARFNVREYWIVDPDAKTLTVLVLSEGQYEPAPPRENGEFNSRVLPGLVLKLDQVAEARPGIRRRVLTQGKIMATTVRLTIDELEFFSEAHEGDRHELIDGVLFVTPVPGLNHLIFSLNLIRALDRYVDG